MGVFDGDPTPTVSPSISESPSPSTSPSGPVSYFDDGIADDEYPAEATSRGVGFPDALQMEDWVWDRVGPNWALAMFGPDPEIPTSVAAVYLISPEGVYFEVTALPSNIREYPTIVSWHEGTRSAGIQWRYRAEGGLLSLMDGSVSPMSFAMESGTSQSIGFLAANPSNREVWVAYGLEWQDVRFYTWTESESWSALFGSNRDLVQTGSPSSADGSKVLLEIAQVYDSGLASERSGDPGRPNLVIYNLNTGQDSFVEPLWPSDSNWCYLGGWIDDVSVSYNCWSDVSEENTTYRVFVDSNRPVQIWDEVTDQGKIFEGAVVDLEGTPLEFVSESESTQIYEIRLLTDEGPVTVASYEDYLLRSGHPFGGVIEVAPGVFRVWTYDNVVLGIDATTGTVAPYLPARSPAGDDLLPRSYVFYDEGTTPGANQGYWDGECC
jgi:hypothetical protein